MKKVLLCLLLLVVPAVLAYGGDTYPVEIPNCEGQIGIYVEGIDIVEGEYWIENCTRLFNDSQNYDWVCDCTGSTTILMFHVKPNAINSYNLTAFYPITAPPPSPPPTSSGGGGGRRTYFVYLPSNQTEEDKEVIPCPLPDPDMPLLNVTEENYTSPIEEENETWELVDEKETVYQQPANPFWGVIIIIGVPVFGVLVYMLYLWKKGELGGVKK